VPGEAAAALVIGPRDEVAGLGWIDARTGADGSDGEPAAERIAEVARVLHATRGPAELIDGAARAVVAHDAAERAAMAGVITDVPLVATASAMGALGAAAAPVSAIALVEMLRRGALAPIAGMARPAEGPLRPVLGAEATSARAALGLVTGAPGCAGAVRVEVR
jgi:3-oxoacyl-(acyl-carrier-protein) synthase